jgi:hypothetical protein
MDPSESELSDSLPHSTANAKRQASSSSETIEVEVVPTVKRSKSIVDAEEGDAIHSIPSLLQEFVDSVEEGKKIAAESSYYDEASKDADQIAAPKYRLPRYMKIGTSVPNDDDDEDDEDDSQFEFISAPSTSSYLEMKMLYDTIGGGCTNVEMLPLVAELHDNGYEAYMDGEGKMKDLPMNCKVNPFMEDNTLCYMAMGGGPYGAAVICKKNGLSWKKLVSLCKACDKRDDTTEWTGMLIEARDDWDALRKSISETDG